MSEAARDHGGGIDAAIRQYGGSRADWLDLSTGINPQPYPLPEFDQSDWGELPDAGAMGAMIEAARQFWCVPNGVDILAAPGASALIARLPYLREAGKVAIAARTYNEHAAAFQNAGWKITDQAGDARVVVHPNNPDGNLWDGRDERPDARSLLVIDESFCDVAPDQSHIDLTARPGVILLKSFGKFWGLAGVRLGFAMGHTDTLAPLRDMLGPWPVAGPALRIGAQALRDVAWAKQTRDRLARDANRLDQLMLEHGKSTILGGTSLFRLYNVADAMSLQTHLATHHILSRVFPYSSSWLRLGLPGSEEDWKRLENALISAP